MTFYLVRGEFKDKYDCFDCISVRGFSEVQGSFERPDERN